MKHFFIAISLLIANSLNAQTPKDFIKNYKAPDFKLRYMNLNFSGSSNSHTPSSIGSSTNYTLSNSALSSALMYGLIFNDQKKQGSLRILNGISGDLRSDSLFVYSAGTASLSVNFENRWYRGDRDFFIGLHNSGGLKYQVNATNQNEVDNQHNFMLDLKPAFSVGFGRVEYATFARQAMDIELMLLRSKRLNNKLDEEQMKILADKLCTINYKRGFDRRLLRIWQLEQIDSTLGVLDVVKKRDMRYMAFLNDAYIYGEYTNRLSGKRIEWGITQSGLLRANNNVNIPDDNYMSAGFASYSVYLPTSYAFQHDFKVTALAGWAYNDLVSPDFSTWAGGSYTFGWYPNTRTALRTSLTLDMNLGEAARLKSDLSFYYYFSPRTRLNILASLYAVDSYYEGHGFNQLALGMGTASFFKEYDFRVSLTHAIF